MKTNKAILNTTLKALADEAHESLLEIIDNTYFNDYDYVAINDTTPPGEDLPLLLNDNVSPVTRLLAAYRLKGKSTYDIGILKELENLILENEADPNVSFDFDSGRLWTVAKIYEALGSNEEFVKTLKSWAHFNPHN